MEIPSFPIAIMMVVATADSRIKRTYALAEAKRASTLLKGERKETIMKIANNFKWKLEPAQPRPNLLNYDFALDFKDYIRNAAIIQHKKWKLVNRMLSKGEVFLTKVEVCRLLEEEVRRYIEQKLQVKVKSLSPDIMNRINRLKQLFYEKRGKTSWEEIPSEVIIIAYPPCIKRLHETISSGHHLSHIGRFTLTTFLVNIGMTTENVVDLFRSLADFKERMTRYQVEHIAGLKGSRTKYIPPQCDTLRTHGVCPGMDDICRRIRHPLAYYRRKLRIIKTEAPLAPGA
ncbi:MAG: DNA primase regulatory subunit PriL [Candidatus Bathyarchaeota archaeon]|nr:DNA primase regulatory subunit PriL [Candidatus Bathyarchaeota archaeon]